MKLLCEDQVSVVQLTAAGLFIVDQGCIIKYQIQAPEISPINRLYNISLPELSIPDKETDNMTHNLQLQEIREQLDIMKRNEPLAESVSYHDAHHDAAIYVLFVAVGAMGAALVWWRCRRTPTTAAVVAGTAGAAVPQPSTRHSVSAVQ